MKVENTEINGFVIDKFNQHGLEDGKTQGVCPWSSKCRKPENQKKQCASYDWERGLGTCHNCDKTFQLHMEPFVWYYHDLFLLELQPFPI